MLWLYESCFQNCSRICCTELTWNSFQALARTVFREEKRKARTLRKMGLTEEEEMAERIGTEERKLLLAQRKLESIRILDELLERVKVKCPCLLCVVQACLVI